MAAIYEYNPVRRTAAYNSVVVTIYQVQVLCCESTHTVPNKNTWKKNDTKKKGKHAGIWTLDFVLWGSAIYFWTTRFHNEISQIDVYLYVRIHTGNFEEKTKTALLPRRQREHGRGRPRQSRERRARWGTSSKHHTEWWTSSRASL